MFTEVTDLSFLNIGCVCRAENATEAWEYWYKELEELHKSGFSDTSRDGDVVGEYMNTVTVISNPKDNIVLSDIRKLNLKYMIGEFLWYNSHSNYLSGIQNYTSAWDRMSDDGITVNSNYGHKIHKFYGFDQWNYVKELLMKDPNSRQAIIHIKNPDTEPSKDVPCTISLQFFIRENKLYLTTYMRSNDIWMGFPYDVFNFTCMQIQMAMELGVGIGCYTHIAGSMHLYKRNSKYLPEKEDSSVECKTEQDKPDSCCKHDSDCKCHSNTPKIEGLHRSI